jgi:hypothetical protein
MSEDRSRILNLLAEGKITAQEAERLLEALDTRVAGATGAGSGAGGVGTTAETGIHGDPGPLLEALPKFLYVKVNAADGDTVDVKIPISLVRSGLKLTSLIPPQAMDEINDSMAEHGMSIDFSNLKPEDIDDLVEALREMEINVDAKNGDNVRVYCA